MTVSSVSASLQANPLPPEKNHPVHQLMKGVRTGDLEGARQAYASIVKNAPDGASWDPNSAFAQLGRDLAKGDLAAAKQVIVDAIKQARGGGSNPAPTPQPIMIHEGPPVSRVNLTA